MKPRTSTKVMASAAIVMGWMWLTALQCGDAPTSPTSVQSCTVFYDNNFPIGGFLSLNRPANCPIKLGGTTVVPYAATADLPAGSVHYQFYQFDSRTWNGYGANFFGNAVWSQGNGRYFANITGDYYAASGGFDSNNSGWDDIRNGFLSTSNGQWTYATTRIAYNFGIPSNSIAAPAVVQPAEQYYVSTTTSDPLILSPVTWSWYVDGSFAGNTTNPEFYVQAGEPSTQQHLRVVATDVNGRSVSGETWVTVGSGCDPQIIC